MNQPAKRKPIFGLGWAVNALRNEQVSVLLIAAMIGLAAGLVAIVFKFTIAAFQILFWGSDGLTVSLLESIPWYLRILPPVLGGLLLAPFMLKRFSDGRGSGIPDVIESIAIHGGRIPRRVAPLKLLAASICIGSGGSVGREGPIVHIGASFAALVSRYFRPSVGHSRTFVACGGAAGIAATFNTPFGAALFAVEVLLADFATAKIAPIVIACIVATVITREFSGDFPHLDVPSVDALTAAPQILPYLALGILGGLLGSAFLRILGAGYTISQKWPFSPLLVPVTGGLMVGILGLFFPHVLGMGYDTINNLLSQNFTIGFLMLLLLAKMIATSITVNMGGAGGVFVPCLFVGAVLGALVAAIIESVEFLAPLSSGESFQRTCVLVGMGAVVAATGRSPISAILIIFELTYQPAIITPLMAGCIPAVVITAAMGNDSLYIARLKQKGVELPKTGEINLLKGKKVSEVMEDRIERVPTGMQLRDLVDKFLQTPHPIMWMVDEEDRLVGVIESQNIQIAMLEKESLFSLVVAEDVAVPIKHLVHPGDDLSMVSRIFNDADQQDILPVVDPVSGIIQGDLLRSDVIGTYNRELAIRDSMGVAVDAIGVAQRLRNVDLGGGYRLIEYLVPSHVEGRTFKQMELRRRFGIQAILVQRGSERIVPGPDTELRAGDVVLFAGREESLEESLGEL
ncbi:MAG: chloride channel protein [Candidatus Sumerlaeia bacterium]|nr:chloride channel protein [Candidatus Sumerlaeia bacterium]